MPEAQQRRHGKEDADAQPDPHPTHNWPPRHRLRDREREKRAQDDGKDALHRHSQSRAGNRAKRTHRRRLQQINNHRAARRCAQAAQDRCGAMLLLQVRLDRTRHPHCAEQKRNEADQVQEAVEIVQRLPEILLPRRHRIEVHPQLLDLRTENRHSLLHLVAGRELHVIPVARDAALLEQLRPRQILQRQIDARRKRARRRGFARHLLQRPRDSKLHLANLDRVARLRPELYEQTLIHHRAPASPEILCRGERLRLHRPVKRKVAAQSPRAHQARPAAFGENRHRAETHLARLRLGFV